MGWGVSRNTFEVTMWTLCGLSTLFLASRFAVRMWKKGRLRRSDYCLIAALPFLLTGAGLLQSSLDQLYAYWPLASSRTPRPSSEHASAGPRITLAIEALWVAIYFVKASFFTQFKFHKPPYAYISPRLTRYYWVAVGVCVGTFLLTIIVPAVLCPSSANCRYFGNHDTVAWEIVLTVLDIGTDLLVISIPFFLIWMANFTLSRAVINTSFKSLSIINIAIAACRLAFQYNAKAERINYISLTFWLITEAAAAVIAASISSYRIVVLDYLADRKAQQGINPTQQGDSRLLRTRKAERRTNVASVTAPGPRTRVYSNSELSIQHSARSLDYSL